jgi:hypothetical protein
MYPNEVVTDFRKTPFSFAAAKKKPGKQPIPPINIFRACGLAITLVRRAAYLLSVSVVE